MDDPGRLVLHIGSSDILKSLDEVIENLGGNHDSVAVRADFFGNSHHASSGVALEVDEESFAISNDFFCTNDVVVHFSKTWVLL